MSELPRAGPDPITIISFPQKILKKQNQGGCWSAASQVWSNCDLNESHLLVLTLTCLYPRDPPHDRTRVCMRVSVLLCCAHWRSEPGEPEWKVSSYTCGPGCVSTAWYLQFISLLFKSRYIFAWYRHQCLRENRAPHIDEGAPLNPRAVAKADAVIHT